MGAFGIVGRVRLAGCLGLVVAAGCFSSAPSRISTPGVNPSAAGAEALKLYDADHDGFLSEAELAKCPGMLKALADYDKNGDKKVSADEIATRLQEWIATKTGLTSFSCMVLLDGQPLKDAQVVFEPEPFLGGAIKPCQGTAGPTGQVALGITKENLPNDAKDVTGAVVQYGLYKVRITHPSVQIPAIYNTQTTLGQEIMINILQRGETVKFELSSQPQ